MARIKMNAGTKRTRVKGVHKTKRDAEKKPLSYKLNTKDKFGNVKKVGPKVKNFNGDTIGHAQRSVFVTTDETGKKYEHISFVTVFTQTAEKTIKDLYKKEAA